MRVILTCNYSPWSSYSGGGQRSTDNLARALVRRRHDVTVVFTRPPWERVPVPADLPYRLCWAGLTTIRGSSPGPLRLTSILPVARVVARLVRQGGPVVVHSQGEESAALPSLRRTMKRPFGLVVTPRYPVVPAAILAGATATVIQRLRSLLFDSKYVALGLALRGADFCSPPSAYGARLVQRAYDLRDEQIEPVHNGVPAEFLDYRWEPGDGTRPILFFGRFARAKGIDTLLDALLTLGPRGPRAVLVGRGPAQREIELRIRNAGLGDRVTLHGWADHHTLGKLLCGASMAVLPSREENFSLAVLSALAVGTPLVTTPVGGTPEVLEHERNGLLVETGDGVALAGAIDRLIRDPAFAARLGAAGREDVRREFTWDMTASRFETLYSRTLAAA